MRDLLEKLELLTEDKLKLAQRIKKIEKAIQKKAPSWEKQRIKIVKTSSLPSFIMYDLFVGRDPYGSIGFDKDDKTVRVSVGNHSSSGLSDDDAIKMILKEVWA